MIDLNLVRVFVAVYRHSSYTLAARELNLSQPAVSQAIRRFESSLNALLFVNEGRRPSPTPYATRLIRHLGLAVDSIDGVLAQKRDVCAYVNEAYFHLFSDIEYLIMRQQPRAQKQMLEDLQANKIELLLDTVAHLDSNFIVEELMSQPLVVVCRQAHPRVCENTLTKELFYSEEHVVLQLCPEKRQILESFAKEPVGTFKDKLEVSSVASLLMSVSRSNCLGIVNAAVAKEWADILRLQVLPLPIVTEPVPLQMIYHQRYALDPHHQMIRNEICHRISRSVQPL
ncbi:LysR family transcriptional regulator [Photobacterium rosenbergii]|uniref:LysR family transcriptional regulator n=1 Tax=Photobacterium rosenbergii TaxID=294936 RepID=UPI001C995BEA|nr:LysR family transcriptional regulator [Photobacterium rosenbergii]MBY5945061.1 LysR family transcriptional regulator [Photobacterium rosenbergii]